MLLLPPGLPEQLKGERIATLFANSIEACIAMFGVMASGAQLVPLNPLYTKREIDEIVADAEPASVLREIALFRGRLFRLPNPRRSLSCNTPEAPPGKPRAST